VSGAEGSNENRFAFSSRFIPDGIRRAQVRMTLTYRLTPRLQAGIEVNPRSTEERANPLVNWLAVPEGKNTPAVIAGTSSDRIGTPGGQSFYATASKNLKRETKLPIAPYFGVAYGTYQDRLRYIGGVKYRLHGTAWVTRHLRRCACPSVAELQLQAACVLVHSGARQGTGHQLQHRVFEQNRAAARACNPAADFELGSRAPRGGAPRAHCGSGQGPRRS
jgi:hypothetical protein